MILQSYIPEPTPEVSTGVKITMPGQSVDIKQALQQYSRGTMEQRAIGYYENKGMEVPDFGRMSHIERLVALGEYRNQVLNIDRDLQAQSLASQAKKKDAILQQTVKQKVDEELKQQRKSHD